MKKQPEPTPGIKHDADGNVVEKRGAIFAIPWELVVRGLEAVGALPPDAYLHAAPDMPATVEIKANHPLLPIVPEGEPYPRRGPWRTK